MLIAPVFIVAKTWKQSQYPPIDDWTSTMKYKSKMEKKKKSKMEYYSAFKKNEILTHALTWMHLEDENWFLLSWPPSPILRLLWIQNELYAPEIVILDKAQIDKQRKASTYLTS